MTYALPPLQPFGVGTGLVESLTSYVRRMSALLGITNLALLRWLIPAAAMHAYTEAINGTERLGEEVAAALVRATGIPEIAQTSLFATRGLHLRRDFTSTRRWCPICLRDTGYDPLVLAFRVATTCPVHQVLLLSRCTNGHQQRTWAAWARPRQCAECGTTLDDTATPHSDRSSSVAVKLIEWIQAGNQIEPARIAAWLRRYRGQAPIADCAAHFRWAPATVINIESGAQRLQFSTVLQLVQRTNATAQDLHDPDPVAPGRRAPRNGLVRPIVDVRSLRRAVRRELQRPIALRRSVMALAAASGVSHVTLRRHVPEVQLLIDERRTARGARRLRAS